MSFRASMICPECKSVNEIHITDDNDIKFKCYSCGLELVYTVDNDPENGENEPEIDKEIVSSNTEKPHKKKKYNKQKEVE